MKAPVLFQPKEPLRAEELEVESPREGEVPIRIGASGTIDEANEGLRDLASGALARGLIAF